MKKFNYHSIKDTKEASKLSSANSIFLAGGMTVIPSIKLGLGSYKDVIDIKEIKKLSGIKVSGKIVKIGATTNSASKFIVNSYMVFGQANKYHRLCAKKVMQSHTLVVQKQMYRNNT